MNKSTTIMLLVLALVSCIAGGIFLISRNPEEPAPPEPAPQLAGDLPTAIQWSEPVDSGAPDVPPMQGDDNQWIRSGSVDSIPPLIRHLKDDNVMVQRAALREFAGMGAKARSAVPTILEALKSSNVSIRFEAAITLIQMNVQSNAAVDALIAELRSEDADNRASAATVIAELIDPPAPTWSCWGPDPAPQIARPWVGRRTLAALRDAARDPNAIVADAAANAIRRLECFMAAKPEKK